MSAVSVPGRAPSDHRGGRRDPGRGDASARAPFQQCPEIGCGDVLRLEAGRLAVGDVLRHHPLTFGKMLHLAYRTEDQIGHRREIP